MESDLSMFRTEKEYEEKNKDKILILSYDPNYTYPEDLQALSDSIADAVNFTVLFLPKYWSYEFMTKEETLARLRGMIDFINMTRRDDE